MFRFTPKVFKTAKFLCINVKRSMPTYLNTPNAKLAKNFLLLGGFYDLMLKPPEEFEKEFKKACINNENAITELLTVIKTCIEEISQEYRVCIDKQIEITVTATELGPVGDHWDDMTKYRVQAHELKQELESYKYLLKSVGNMENEQTHISFLTGSKDTLEHISARYANMRKSIDEQLKINLEYERKLLSVHRESILKSGKVYES